MSLLRDRTKYLIREAESKKKDQTLEEKIAIAERQATDLKNLIEYTNTRFSGDIALTTGDLYRDFLSIATKTPDIDKYDAETLAKYKQLAKFAVYKDRFSDLFKDTAVVDKEDAIKLKRILKQMLSLVNRQISAIENGGRRIYIEDEMHPEKSNVISVFEKLDKLRGSLSEYLDKKED